MERDTSRIPIVTILLVSLAILGPFFFPWSVALILGTFAALFFPPVIILTGVLIDTLYFSTHSFPYFTILSLIIAVVAFFVQQFVKTRIMS